MAKLTVPVTVLPADAFSGNPAKLALMSAALAATLNVAVLLAAMVSLIAPVVPVPATPVVVCKKLIEALTVAPGVTLASVAVPNITMPVTELYTPVPSNTLVAVTLAVCKPIGSCNVNTAVVAVLLAVVLIFTKLAVPLTTVLTGALAGKPAKLALMSAALAATLKVAVLLAALVSLFAPVVPVPCTPVVVCKKLIEALTVLLGVTLTTVGAPGNVTRPVPGA